MRTVIWCITISLATHIGYAKIKNGYGLQINTVKKSLESLRALYKRNDITLWQRLQLKTRINQHIDFVSHYRQTEELLQQFRLIAPELYNEIDTIRDKQGREVDVYVRLVFENEMEMALGGYTNLDHVAEDADAYQSSYGPNTVSIKIKKIGPALVILAHEFGHVKYQVLNLALYSSYYNNTYLKRKSRLKLIGHDVDDPSGKSADEFARRFKDYQRSYTRLISEPAQPL